MQLGALLEHSAASRPDAPLLIFRDQPIPYGALANQVARFAGGLRQLGIGVGDRVGLMAHNVPQFVIAYYGILRVGAIVVPINVMLKPQEVGFILADCQAKAVVTLEPFYPVVQAARPQLPALDHAIVWGASTPPGAVAWDSVLAADPIADYDGDPADTAVICYTSGTTGRPKGAMLSHYNLLANCDQTLAVERTMIDSADRVLLVLPLFHIYAMNVGLNLSVKLGLSAVLLERFDPVQTLEQLAKHRVTVFFGAPPIYVAWATMPNFKDYDLSALRVAASGAAALPVAILEGFEKRTGVQIQEGYGLTEVSPVATSNAAGPVTKPGSIGRPVPQQELRIVDVNDQDVAVGEVGEIVLRGPNVMKGYFNQPEATAEAFRNGWFHTGDMARADDDGYIYIVDRKKDMIIVSGFNVYPREVEEFLYHHPKIADAAVIGVPDSYQGESVLALVVLKANETATEAELIEWCRSQMASYKAPRAVQFRESLPKLPTGKVLRRALREEVQAARAATT